MSGKHEQLKLTWHYIRDDQQYLLSRDVVISTTSDV